MVVKILTAGSGGVALAAAVGSALATAGGGAV